MTQKPPNDLSAAAKRLWRDIAETLDLDPGGAVMLALLCEAHDRRAEARRAIAKEGAVFTDRFGQVKASPWTAIERDSGLAIQRAYHALGLDLDTSGGES